MGALVTQLNPRLVRSSVYLYDSGCITGVISHSSWWLIGLCLNGVLLRISVDSWRVHWEVAHLFVLVAVSNVDLACLSVLVEVEGARPLERLDDDNSIAHCLTSLIEVLCAVSHQLHDPGSRLQVLGDLYWLVGSDSSQKSSERVLCNVHGRPIVIFYG